MIPIAEKLDTSFISPLFTTSNKDVTLLIVTYWLRSYFFFTTIFLYKERFCFEKMEPLITQYHHNHNGFATYKIEPK